LIRKKGKAGIRPQREQVEGAVLRDAAVDRLDAAAELGAHPVAQQIARGQEGEARADRRGEGDDQHALPQAEDRSGRQRHDGGPGQRQAGHRDVDEEEAADHQQRALLQQSREILLPRLEVRQRQILAEVEQEKGRDGPDEQEQEADLAFHEPARRPGLHRLGTRSSLAPSAWA
jgi:hypothetical protein